jgi:hypothetical protein
VYGDDGRNAQWRRHPLGVNADNDDDDGHVGAHENGLDVAIIKTLLS